MSERAFSPFTGNVFARRIPVRLQAARGGNPLLQRIIQRQALGNWLLPSLAAMTPQYIETILRGALGGNHVQQWELFDLMTDTWPRLAKNTAEINAALVAMDWKLEAWAEDEQPPSDTALERKKIVSAGVWQMQPPPDEDLNGFEQLFQDLGSAWFVGLSVSEILWEHRRVGNLGEFALPQCTAWIHPSNYGWSEEGFLGLRLNQPSTFNFQPATSVERFPEHRFLIALNKARSGPAMTGARLRSLAWWWCAANFSADWLMNLAQLFGLPFRWATYADNADAETVTQINAMLADMGSAGYGAFPEGTNLNFLEVGKSAGTSPQDGLLDRADKACDLLLHWETTTSEIREQGGAYASAKVGLSKQAKAVMACANFVARVLNQQLVPAILRENFGDAGEAPYFCPEFETQKDLQATATMIKSAVDTGLQVPKKWAHSELNIPLPQTGEEVLERSAAVSPDQPQQPGKPVNVEDDDESEEAGDPKDLEARAALRAAALTPEERFALSLAEKTDPVLTLLKRIAKIKDDAAMMATLQRFYEQAGTLTNLITADVTRQQRALETITAGALKKGLEGK